MPEAGVTDIQDLAQIYVKGSRDTDLANRILEAGGYLAERWLRRHLNADEDDIDDGTNDRYQDVIDNNTDGDVLYDSLVKAEALLATFYAIPRLQVRITKKGGLVRATGNVDQTVDLMSHNEMNAYRSQLKQDAQQLLEDVIEDEDEDANIVYTL